MAQRESRSRSASRSTDHNNHDRLEPLLLRAAESDDVEKLREIVDAARARKQLNENFLRIGLMRSSEKGKVQATTYLLSQGAQANRSDKNRLSPLLRAVERNHIAIVQVLLAHNADPETHDKKGRTALMTAAWKNHWHILEKLVQRGANVNAKDNKSRNVLHNLAADKKPEWGDVVIQFLLNLDIYIDGEKGQDSLKRTPLHWACATGKLRLAEQLLMRSKGARAHIDAVEIRDKTSLHIAAAHDRNDIVELLLEHGAFVNARSDGGWTPLHNACEKGAIEIVIILLRAGAEVNAKLLNGMTSLHLAAQGGHSTVVEYLLECHGIKRTTRDSFGFTPFLRAAQNKHKHIASLLAPFNQIASLSEDALGACNGFNATIVDFGDFHNENRVQKHTVYELLYGKDPMNPAKSARTILPSDDKATKFRWIHLPANNMAWVEALLTKGFIEEGASDVDGFKALERSFSHQHRGQQSHSHFMRPICQTTPRTQSIKEANTVVNDAEQEHNPPIITVNGRRSESAARSQPMQGSASNDNGGERSSSNPPQISGKALSKPATSPQMGKENGKTTNKDKGRKAGTKANKSPKIGGSETPTRHQTRRMNYNSENKRFTIPPNLRRDPSLAVKSNVFTFMPYLHFETDRRRQEMQEAIKRAEVTMQDPKPRLKKATTYDEMMIRAHLATSTVSLHVRRTLDQSFYHNIDTGSRDVDQVVYRYQLRSKGDDDHDFDPKVVMVDQLWMWILGKDLIVTAFPQRWQQPKNDPLNVLDSIIEDINSKTRDSVKSVYELAIIITNRCSGVFSRHRMGDDEYQFLDMFESSIGNATDRETVLFKEFNAASAQASAWLQHHRQRRRIAKYFETEENKEEGDTREDRLKFDEFMRGPLFVDKLLDIGQETNLLAETKDIRDELNMILKVLEDQLGVLPDLQNSICDIYYDEHTPQRDMKKQFDEQIKGIKTHIKDIDRMDKQAERIYKSITDMLDLKQKHANAFEARFARDQAEGTSRQSQTIMVFTIVTIIFLPLSFIAAFFTINIAEFPRTIEGSDSLPLSYVSKYVFGVGFAISIPMIMVSLLLDDILELYKWMIGKAKAMLMGKKGGNMNYNSSMTTLGKLDLEQVFSVAKERRSRDTHRPVTRETIMSPQKCEIPPTGFKMRISQDIESGLPEVRRYYTNHT